MVPSPVSRDHASRIVSTCRRQRRRDPVPGTPHCAMSALQTDIELLRRLEDVATRVSGGHLTIMRFSTNWRV
jgi:hypothetical protein